ncbi:uncharacterized protein LOC129588917 [Paramacrobiotus metropolitanus]|uniref:uncharacterized protein LOC129588917 n=1 Tax=Paramacrobiotus metropolitanus TaxID=2943436 RepID=UPI002445DB38|nr:uncharacterized protein LOC129588917 [Paramacrobiotus metropolitanus]
MGLWFMLPLLVVAALSVLQCNATMTTGLAGTNATSNSGNWTTAWPAAQRPVHCPPKPDLQAPAAGMPFILGPCIQQCFADSQCSTGQKCCPLACGSACIPTTMM